MFDLHLRELDALMDGNTRFGDLEEWINGRPLADDAKAALWLYAWSEQPRQLRRTMLTTLVGPAAAEYLGA